MITRITIKEILKKTLILAAIMVLIVFFVSFLSIGATPEMLLVFELFLLAFCITIIQLLLKQLVCTHFMLSLLIEYCLVSGFVLLYGYYVHWFFQSNWWMVFLYVAIVYIPAYLLDMTIVKRELNYINTQLERRRKNETEITK